MNNIDDMEIQEPSIEEIEQQLFEGRWKDEAKLIPTEYLPDDEKKLIETYITGEQLRPDEEEKVKEILDRFRPALLKVEPDVVLENVEENTQYINDEKTFLSLVDESEEVQVIPFTFYIGDRKFQMKFDLYSLTDSQAITDITENLSMFKDMTDDELITYSKMQNGETLTREELLVRASLERKIQKATVQNTRDTLIEYLSIQLKFHGQDTSIEDMRKVFAKIPNAYLSLLFDEVQRRNHLGDLDTEEVFQPIS